MADLSPADVERVRNKWIEIAQVAPDEATRGVALKQLAKLSAEHPVRVGASDEMRGPSRDYAAAPEDPTGPVGGVQVEPGTPDSDLIAEAERNPQGAMGKALGTMAGTGVSLAAGAAAPEAGLLARLAYGGAAGGAAGAADASTNAAVTGAQVLPAAKGGAAMGALVGLGGEALGSLAGGVSSALRSNRQIGTLARANEAGLYDTPEMAALPKGEEGNRAAAEIGLRRILTRDQQLGQQAGDAYQAAVGPHLDQPVDRAAIIRALEDERAGNLNPDNGRPLRPAIDRALLTAAEDTPANPTVRGTLARRRALQQDAGFQSVNPTPEQETTRDVYRALRQGVRNASPEVASADDQFAQYAQQAGRRRDILFNTEDNVVRGGGDHPELQPGQMLPEDIAGPSLRVGKERAAATTLARVGDENAPGMSVKRYLEELAQQDPEFAAAIDMIAAKKAQEATRYSLEGHSPLSLHGATELHGLGPLIRQNARAIGADAEAVARGAQPALRGLGRVPMPGLQQEQRDPRLPPVLPTDEALMQAMLDAQDRRRR